MALGPGQGISKRHDVDADSGLVMKRHLLGGLSGTCIEDFSE